jgi:hypothetical protein
VHDCGDFSLPLEFIHAARADLYAEWRMQTKKEVSPEQLQLWFEEIMTAATRICDQYGIGPSGVRLAAPADQQKKAS